MSWKGEGQSPPFNKGRRADRSRVPERSKDPAVAALFQSVGLTAAYTALSSLHHFQRAPALAPKSNTITRFSNFVARKRGGSGSTERRGPGLLEAFRLAVNQRRLDPALCNMTAAATEIKLLERWDGVTFGTVSEIAQPASSGADGLSQ
eukprot:6182166-Pleurochrysis_carterae.AAC.2